MRHKHCGRCVSLKKEVYMSTVSNNDDLKRVLFGLQKQANAINDGVVEIVAMVLDKLGADRSSEEACVNSIKETLEKILRSEVSREDVLIKVFVILTAGVCSWDVLDECVPATVLVNRPSQDSPKFIFRVTNISESMSLFDEQTEIEIKQSQPPTVETTMLPSETFAGQAKRALDSILPCVPNAVKQEIPGNVWAQALCCAEAFYKSRM